MLAIPRNVVEGILDPPRDGWSPTTPTEFAFTLSGGVTYSDVDAGFAPVVQATLDSVDTQPLLVESAESDPWVVADERLPPHKRDDPDRHRGQPRNLGVLVWPCWRA